MDTWEQLDSPPGPERGLKKRIIGYSLAVSLCLFVPAGDRNRAADVAIQNAGIQELVSAGNGRRIILNREASGQVDAVYSEEQNIHGVWRITERRNIHGDALDVVKYTHDKSRSPASQGQ